MSGRFSLPSPHDPYIMGRCVKPLERDPEKSLGTYFYLKLEECRLQGVQKLAINANISS